MSKAILAILGVGVGVAAIVAITSAKAHAAAPVVPPTIPDRLVTGKRYVVQVQWPTPLSTGKGDANLLPAMGDAEKVFTTAFREADGFAETDVVPTADPRNIVMLGEYTGAPIAPGRILALLELAPATRSTTPFVLQPHTRYEIEIQTLLPLPSDLLRELLSQTLGGFHVEGSRELPAAGNIRSFVLTGTYTNPTPAVLQNDPSISTFTRATPLAPLVTS